MEAPTTRTFTPARIVALALIALMAVGLAYLRFAPESDVSVPKGAKAGQLTLEHCDYATEDGSYAADCGTLVVPENYSDPQSRLIALPVTRIRATSKTPAEPIFRLQGGPGVTNMKFAHASRFAGEHDVVLVGYRGVEGSSVLDCPEVESALAHSTDFLDEKSFEAHTAAFRACATRLSDDGVDLAGYTPQQRVDDLEAVRRALGYERINLVSESAGTRTAMIYAWRYPNRIHRSVMIGVNPPGNFAWEARTTDEQIDRYAALCAADADCAKRTDDLAASMKRTSAEMPDRWFFLPIKDGHARFASFFGLMESTPESAPLSGPMTIDAWLAAEEGDASGLWFLSLASQLIFPKAVVWGEFAAFSSVDAQAVRDHFSPGRQPDSILDDAGTALVWGNGRLADAWPVAPDADEYSRVRTSNVETLLIGGELDFATPPQNATKELLPHLPNGHEVVLPSFGHSTSFWLEQPEAGAHLINTFFDSGRVDESRYERQTVDFTPELTHTALGKGFAGTMVGLALLTVLSLLLMARRVHRRGRFGPKASATLRSVYPIVLGLGGYLLGVLIVLTTMPGTRLDDELLAALSVGLPIGLGVYFGWVNRDSGAKTKLAGFAASVGGALVGAWLGFHAATDMLALVTAIVGGAIGANLTLIALDIARARSARDRVEVKAASAAPASSGA